MRFWIVRRDGAWQRAQTWEVDGPVDRISVLDDHGTAHPLVMVGPIAVAPERQQDGIGRRLTTAALDAAAAHGLDTALMLIGENSHAVTSRLAARLANVAILPRYGEAVYWHEPGRFVQQLHGQHGGLSPQEMEIPLVAWVA